MKASYFCLPFIIMAYVTSTISAQSLEERILRKTKQRADRKIDRTIDKGLDKVEKGIDSETSDKKSSNEKSTQGKSSTRGTTSSEKDTSQGGKGTDKNAFETYSKFDFIPGEKIIAVEDFSQDAIGDFPAKWNTNGGGEIVKINGEEGHWLALTTKGNLTPEFITSLPENFTLEFDLATNPEYNFYDAPLIIRLMELNDRTKFNERTKNFVSVYLHPEDAGGKFGKTGFEIFQNGQKTMYNNRSNLTEFNAKTQRQARVSIWRQGQRIRMYINESKVWDLPRAFNNNAKYNALVFDKGGAKDGNNYYISNIRLAVGAPDTRNKLITEGRFTTTGIYFNTNSATLKPESNGVLKEIADVLQENPDVKIKIIGHTDSDGDDKLNLELSKKRALAVKNALTDVYKITSNRIETDGKGESQPSSANNTPEGKAANRRVEFIKL